MTEKDTRNVHQRILAVKKKVQYIQKEDAKQGMPYRAISHDRVTWLTREHFIANGINVFSTVEESTQSGNRTESKVRTIFVNVDDPEDHYSVVAIGYGIDSSDKGPGKAFSYGVKGCILKALNIQSGTEEEVDFHNIDYDANPEAATPPELAEVTRQAKDGRPALVESVQKWLVMDDATVETQNRVDLGRALSTMIGVYYGPEQWFTNHIKDHPDFGAFYQEGNPVKIANRMQKTAVVRMFIKYRLRVLDMAEFNKYDYSTVQSHINALNGMKAGVDIYSLDEGEFSKMVGALHDELKG